MYFAIIVWNVYAVIQASEPEIKIIRKRGYTA